MQQTDDSYEQLSVSQRLQRFRQMEKQDKAYRLQQQQPVPLSGKRFSGRNSTDLSSALAEKANMPSPAATQQPAAPFSRGPDDTSTQDERATTGASQDTAPASPAVPDGTPPSSNHAADSLVSAFPAAAVSEEGTSAESVLPGQPESDEGREAVQKPMVPASSLRSGYSAQTLPQSTADHLSVLPSQSEPAPSSEESRSASAAEGPDTCFAAAATEQLPDAPAVGHMAPESNETEPQGAPFDKSAVSFDDTASVSSVTADEVTAASAEEVPFSTNGSAQPQSIQHHGVEQPHGLSVSPSVLQQPEGADPTAPPPPPTSAAVAPIGAAVGGTEGAPANSSGWASEAIRDDSSENSTPTEHSAVEPADDHLSEVAGIMPDQGAELSVTGGLPQILQNLEPNGLKPPLVNPVWAPTEFCDAPHDTAAADVAAFQDRTASPRGVVTPTGRPVHETTLAPPQQPDSSESELPPDALPTSGMASAVMPQAEIVQRVQSQSVGVASPPPSRCIGPQADASGEGSPLQINARRPTPVRMSSGSEQDEPSGPMRGLERPPPALEPSVDAMPTEAQLPPNDNSCTSDELFFDATRPPEVEQHPAEGHSTDQRSDYSAAALDAVESQKPTNTGANDNLGTPDASESAHSESDESQSTVSREGGNPTANVGTAQDDDSCRGKGSEAPGSQPHPQTELDDSTVVVHVSRGTHPGTVDTSEPPEVDPMEESLSMLENIRADSRDSDGVFGDPKPADRDGSPVHEAMTVISSDDDFGDFDEAGPPESAVIQQSDNLSDSNDEFGDFDTVPAVDVARPRDAEGPCSEPGASVHHPLHQQQQQQQQQLAQATDQFASTDRGAEMQPSSGSQASILELHGDAFRAAVADLLASALGPPPPRLSAADSVALPRLADLMVGTAASLWGPASTAVTPFTSQSSRAQSRFQAQLALQQPAGGRRHGSSRSLHSLAQLGKAPTLEPGQPRCGGITTGGMPPRAPSLSSAHRLTADRLTGDRSVTASLTTEGLRSRRNSTDSITGDGGSSQSIQGGSVTSVGGGSASDPGLRVTGFSSGWEDDEGGSQLGVHRVAPPASKAVPMFLSVGRSANDAKALPKRRLSKFGTPDVNRPPPPKPVEVAPPPPSSHRATLPRQDVKAASPVQPQDPFAMSASHDLVTIFATSSELHIPPQSASPSATASFVVNMAPSSPPSAPRNASGFANTSTVSDPFADVRDKLPIDTLEKGVDSVTVANLAPLTAAFNAASNEEGHVDPLYSTLAQTSMRSQEISDTWLARMLPPPHSSSAATPPLDEMRILPHSQQQQQDGLPLKTYSSSATVFPRADCTQVAEIAASPGLQQSQLPETSLRVESSTAVMHDNSFGVLDVSAVIAAENDTETPSASYRLTSVHNSNVRDIQNTPQQSFFLQPPPSHPIQNAFTNTTLVTGSPSVAANAVDIFAGQVSLVSTLTNRHSATPSDSEFGDFEGSSSPVPLQSSAVAASATRDMPPRETDEASVGSDSDDFGEFTAPADDANNVPAALRNSEAMQSQSAAATQSSDTVQQHADDQLSIDDQSNATHDLAENSPNQSSKPLADKDPFADLW